MKIRASVSVIALVTVSILLLIGVGITNMVYFSMTSSSRDFEVTRGRWFLEGRVEEYFDAVISGSKELRPGQLVFKERIDGRNQEYRFEISKNSAAYTLHATMRWKDRYTIEQSIEFRRRNAFEYAFFLAGDKDVEITRDMLFSGRVGFTGSWSVREKNDQHVWGDGHTVFEYADAVPVFSPRYSEIPVRDILKNPNGVFNLSRMDPPADAFRKDPALTEMRLPSFDAVWKTYTSMADPSWIIDESTMFDRYKVLNALTSEKELIAFGDGFSTRFPIEGQDVRNVYLMQTASDARFQMVPSLDYLYFRGPENRSAFFMTKGKELQLLASQNAVSMNMPEESLGELSYFGFKGGYYCYLSKDEGVSEVFFEEPDGKHRLVEGVDYEYEKDRLALHILSAAFMRKHSTLLGKGDGKRINFPFQNMGRIMYIYVGGKRSTSYSLGRNTIVFTTAPDPGVEVRTFFDPPRVIVKKAPPGPSVGVFIDKIDDCVVLNLDQIQNPPARGVIISTQPLLIKGTTRSPLAIITSESIYIESVNPSFDDAAPVLLASGKGVWIYRRPEDSASPINKCFIYSPLSGIYTVLSTGDIQNPPVNIWGSSVFTEEKNTGVIVTSGTFEKNFFYWNDAREWLNRDPFVSFPFSLDVLRVRRN
jgi:hypothetical protein